MSRSSAGSGAKGPAHRFAARGKGRRSVGAGWEFVHVCVDDATRIAYVEVLADEKATTCIAFLRRAIRQYAAHGIEVERLMTDNDSGYRSKLHQIACRTLGIKHLRTRPTAPAPTESRNASSAPCSAAGPTARSTATPKNAQPPSTAGSGPTITNDHTVPSATSPDQPTTPADREQPGRFLR